MDSLLISTPGERSSSDERGRHRTWACSFRLWYRRHQTRLQLRRLEHPALDDLGLSETDREAEVKKWFWQA